MSAYSGKILAQCLQLNSARQAITGRWQKSKEDSDDMTAACEAVQLSWVLRRALGLLNTLEVCLPSVGARSMSL